MKNSKTEIQDGRARSIPWVTPKEWIQAVCMLGLLVLIFQPVVQFLRPSLDADQMAIRSLKDLGLATHLYSEDWDDKYPLSHGDIGSWMGWNFQKYVPADWPVVPVPAARVDMSRSFVLNSISPYGLFGNAKIKYPLGPPLGHLYQYQSGQVVRSDRRKLATGYAYNGLLHGYAVAAVTEPLELPLFTALNGNALSSGGGFANPSLICLSSTPAGCTYRPRSGSGCSNLPGGSSTTFDSIGSTTQYVSNHGQHWVFADGHVGFRRLGDPLSNGQTDWQTDPFANYSDTGYAQFSWTDGCHVWLFRPDYDFGV